MKLQSGAGLRLRIFSGYLALGYALCLLLGTGLLVHQSEWYLPQDHHRRQTEALARGELALSHDPGKLTHDLCWSEGGVHQVWGLGIPLWQLPLGLIAKWVGPPAIPEVFAIGTLMVLAAYVVAVAFLLLARRGQVAEFQNGGMTGAGLLILLIFPPFVNLLASCLGIYEEVLVYVYLYALLLIGGMVSLAARPVYWRYAVLCLLAGAGGLIRPTLAFYGIATLVVATLLMWLEHSKTIKEESSHCLRRFLLHWRLWIGLCLFGFGALTIWETNLLRFGSGFEFGHRLNVQSGTLLPSVYATRFDHPFDTEPLWRAARELFGALFLVHDFNGSDWYATEFFAGQSPSPRWREFSFSTYDLSYFILVVAGWIIGFRSAWIGWRKRESTETKKFALTPLLALWSFLACVPLVAFYLRTPPISSRYMMDFAPGFAVAVMIAWWWVFERLKSRKRIYRISGFVFYLGLSVWCGWQIAQMRSMSPTMPVSWSDVMRRRAHQVSGQFAGELPSNYRQGDDLGKWGIPSYNGAGWNPTNGATSVCLILFVQDPEFLELDLVSAPDAHPGRSDAEIIRAKIGLEYLKREMVEQTDAGWRLRFAGPTRPRYQHGVQPVFVATVLKEHLVDEHSPWILKQVSWRSP